MKYIIAGFLLILLFHNCQNKDNNVKFPYPKYVTEKGLEKYYDNCLWEVYKMFYNKAFKCLGENFKEYYLPFSDIRKFSYYQDSLNKEVALSSDTLRFVFTFTYDKARFCEVKDSSNKYKSREVIFIYLKGYPDTALYYSNKQVLDDDFTHLKYIYKLNTFDEFYEKRKFYFLGGTPLNAQQEKREREYVNNKYISDSLYMEWEEENKRKDIEYKRQEKNFYDYLQSNKNNLEPWLKSMAIKKGVIKE